MTQNRQAKNKETYNYSKMLAKKNLVSSQTNGDIIDKLKSNSLYNRFLATLQYCSTKGFDLEKTLEYLYEAFPYFIDKKRFTCETLKNMIRDYPQISAAWGYGIIGDDVSSIMIKNKALELVMKSSSIEDIKVYKEIYDTSEQVTPDNRTIFNFNLDTKTSD